MNVTKLELLKAQFDHLREAYRNALDEFETPHPKWREINYHLERVHDLMFPDSEISAEWFNAKNNFGNFARVRTALQTDFRVWECCAELKNQQSYWESPGEIRIKMRESFAEQYGTVIQTYNDGDDKDIFWFVVREK